MLLLNSIGENIRREKLENILQVTKIFLDEVIPDKVLHIGMIISENVNQKYQASG